MRIKTFGMSLLLLVLVIGTGASCPQKPRGEIRSFTQRIVGIDVSQNPVDQSPQLKLGFISTTYSVVPTATNPIYAPPVRDGIALNHSPLSTHIEESFSTGIATTNGSVVFTNR